MLRSAASLHAPLALELYQRGPRGVDICIGAKRSWRRKLMPPRSAAEPLAKAADVQGDVPDRRASQAACHCYGQRGDEPDRWAAQAGAGNFFSSRARAEDDVG